MQSHRVGRVAAETAPRVRRVAAARVAPPVEVVEMAVVVTEVAALAEVVVAIHRLAVVGAIPGRASTKRWRSLFIST